MKRAETTEDSTVISATAQRRDLERRAGKTDHAGRVSESEIRNPYSSAALPSRQTDPMRVRSTSPSCCADLLPPTGGGEPSICPSPSAHPQYPNPGASSPGGASRFSSLPRRPLPASLPSPVCPFVKLRPDALVHQTLGGTNVPKAQGVC